MFYLYYKGSFTYDNGISFLRVVVCITIVWIYFIILRGLLNLIDFKFDLIIVWKGIGRFRNPTYQIFINEFYKLKTNSLQDARQVNKD